MPTPLQHPDQLPLKNTERWVRKSMSARDAPWPAPNQEQRLLRLVHIGAQAARQDPGVFSGNLFRREFTVRPIPGSDPIDCSSDREGNELGITRPDRVVGNSLLHVA